MTDDSSGRYAERPMALTLEAGDARATVDAVAGGRIASLEVAGLSLLVGPAGDPMRWGCYPMAPWAGRVRNGQFRYEGRDYALPINLPPHAIHGTTFDRPWREEGAGRLSIELGPAWPFPGHAVQQIDLDADRLRLRLEVHARDEPFPASLGWHPWFARELSRGGPAVLSFTASHMLERDAEGIPSGRLVPPPPGPWDDCFSGLTAGPTIFWEGAVAIDLRSNVDHWVVYDEPAHALCVEPQTAAPDALNQAPRRVAPGEPLVAEMEIAWTLDRNSDARPAS